MKNIDSFCVATRGAPPIWVFKATLVDNGNHSIVRMAITMAIIIVFIRDTPIPKLVLGIGADTFLM